ncbi:hypothetical protein GCM10010919_24080 [Alishewanella longhuensis]|uniref:Uncharacterized protein n=1 Tax=Alishewanella longhuensis TaxID=1091037 RepID=A0ABQ3L0W1_9ALTE|nr:hypothetical protein GCM10010919_24080 [Alishewanella longhuensis]
MYHYTESGLSNVYLKNGFTVEEIDGEEYTSIDDMNGLHRTIAQAVVDSRKPLTCQQQSNSDPPQQSKSDPLLFSFIH